MTGSKVRIILSGRLRMITDSGNDIAPTGSKLQGLLALIATEPHRTRRRTWLRDKLWSDRGEAQAQESLRQAILQVKKALGDYKDILHSSRTCVGLDPDRVEVVDTGEGEFCEGLDVRDPEFEEWLREHRSTRERPRIVSPVSVPVPERYASVNRPVVITFDGTLAGPAEILRHRFTHMLQMTLRETLGVNALLAIPQHPQPGSIFISVQLTATTDGKHCLFAMVEDYETRGALWSAFLPELEIELEAPETCRIIALIPQICDAVGEAAFTTHRITGHDRDANLLANLAVRKMFTMDEAELEEADRLLSRAYELEPRGVFQAWRAQVLTIRHVERFETDLKIVREQSREFCASALTSDPTNSNALAAVAFARMIIDKDEDAGMELARIAVRTNCANPLAWSSLSRGYMHFERFEEAHATAIQAQKLADGTRMKFWTDFSRSFAAAAVGNIDEAAAFAASSSALAPNFRPSLRYLSVFSAINGKTEQARKAIARLSDIEKDFSVTRMLTDREYPARFLRQDRYSSNPQVKGLM